MLVIGFAELASRVTVWFLFGVSPLRPGSILHAYYPELRAFPPLQAEEFNVLILGGSTVSARRAALPTPEGVSEISFCDLATLIPEIGDGGGAAAARLVNLAQPAQNSLDCWYKYRALRELPWRAVILYNGVNETRMNNIPPEFFDDGYRHVEFYNELAILFRHAELPATTLPYVMDLLWARFAARTGLVQQIPREHFFLVDSPVSRHFQSFGGTIRTATTYRRNIEAILADAEQRGRSVVLITAAYYIPPDYSLEKFVARTLDFDGHFYPIELFGLPANVAAGISTHNEILRGLHTRHQFSALVELERWVPRSGEYFHDPVHLTTLGCEVLAWAVREALFKAGVQNVPRSGMSGDR